MFSGRPGLWGDSTHIRPARRHDWRFPPPFVVMSQLSPGEPPRGAVSGAQGRAPGDGDRNLAKTDGEETVSTDHRLRQQLHRPRVMLALLALCLPWVSASIQAQAGFERRPITNEAWVTPFEPLRIVGNLYYVGTYDPASNLIATPEGHILINTGA